ncbi:MAG: hypothetical protein ISP37_06575 [Planktomarina sp.]|uniref:hypothetical protein n=1 Tax=Planktomarina sp. TaxID=2024851 RepID=UPI00326129BA|nr:hypothetical protein [Planktomarina sp.]
MDTSLPRYFFRIRENGATLFKMPEQNRQNRLELHQIAVINIRNETVKPQGDTVLTDEETKLIADWMQERKTVLEEREIDDILRTVDHLNLTAQWAQSKASDADLERVTDQLLLSMHDLRTILSRKKAERIMNKP